LSKTKKSIVDLLLQNFKFYRYGPLFHNFCISVSVYEALAKSLSLASSNFLRACAMQFNSVTSLMLNCSYTHTIGLQMALKSLQHFSWPFAPTTFPIA